jgi:hemolysin III
MSTHELGRPTGDLQRDAEELLTDVGRRVIDAVDDIKPRLRGWLHATAAPFALLSLVAVLAVAEPSRQRTGAAIFLGTAVTMFTTSALFHTRRWSSRAFQLWQRADHANIFVLIAGSCTAFAMILLEGRDSSRLLIVMWSGALLGVLFKILWIDAPRWLSVGLYLVLGSSALWYFPEFAAAGAPHALALAGLGGLLYAVGGLVYGLRWPDPLPTYFGFHEVFHALTVTAFAAHCCALALLLR